jgi:mannose-6-phosphate isomerase-like protein (cupin superfamily)
MTNDQNSPVSLARAFASFDQLWSPRIVGRVNDYDVRIAKVEGDYVWHAHEHTDEFFLVVDGLLTIGLRDHDGERSVSIRPGELFVVPAGMEHRPSSVGQSSILMFEPNGTLTTGDYSGDIPEHIDSTVGRRL